MIKIKTRPKPNKDSETIFLNPKFITAIRQKENYTEVSYFDSTGWVGTNLSMVTTEESAESINGRLFFV